MHTISNILCLVEADAAADLTFHLRTLTANSGGDIVQSQPANIHKRWTDVSNIAVEHCLEPWKDAARGTYNIQVIRRAFAFGYRKLGNT